MPVIQVSGAVDRESYEKVRALLPDEAPTGLIAHAAADLPDGSVQIVDVYASRADLEAFVTTSLFPAFAQAGVMELVGSQPAPAAYDTFFLQRG